MSEGRPNFTIPILAVVAFAATLGWLGYRHLRPDPPSVPASPGQSSQATHVEGVAQGRGQEPGSPPSETGIGASIVPPLSASLPSGSTEGSPSAPELSPGPVFDVVRVEPSGESVVAGRAPAGSTVRLTLDGRPIDTVVADASGLFVLTPPAIPPGSHELALEVIGPDGRVAAGRQSVTLAIAEDRRSPPLVTVTAPGQPAIVLSRPDEPARLAAGGPLAGETSIAGTPTGGSLNASSQPPVPESSTDARSLARPVRIATVEAEGTARLLVSGSAQPGSTVRVYVEDALVGETVAEPDGRVAVSLDRGMKPGRYRVRLDALAPGGETVTARAEVAFTAPPEAVGSVAQPGGMADAPVIAPTAPVASAPQRPDIGPRPRVASADPIAPTGAVAPPAIPAAPATAASREPAAPTRPPAPRIRTASVERTGREAERPTRRAPAAAKVAVTVTAGESLWTISRRVYGDAMRYTAVYGANSSQIGDPDVIFPGQVIRLPVQRRPGGR